MAPSKSSALTAPITPTFLVAWTFLFVLSVFYVTEWRMLKFIGPQHTNKENGTSTTTRTTTTAAVAKSVLKPCPPRELGDIFKSQSREDKIIMELLGIHERVHKCGGRYLEIGGLDGILFSNTYAFHHGLQWNGVLVEASPTNFEQLQINRPNETAAVNAGVCNQEQDLHWIPSKISAVGGFYEFADEGFRKRWWSEEAIKSAKVIKCRKLTNILHDAVGPGPFHFDFFSLDVEGAELEVLKSLDFAEYSFGIIFVECDLWDPVKNMGVRTLLELNGYTFIMEKSRSWWFVHQQWHEIYDEVIYAGKNFGSTSAHRT